MEIANPEIDDMEPTERELLAELRRLRRLLRLHPTDMPDLMEAFSVGQRVDGGLGRKRYGLLEVYDFPDQCPRRLGFDQPHRRDAKVGSVSIHFAESGALISSRICHRSS